MPATGSEKDTERPKKRSLICFQLLEHSEGMCPPQLLQRFGGSARSPELQGLYRSPMLGCS